MGTADNLDELLYQNAYAQLSQQQGQAWTTSTAGAATAWYGMQGAMAGGNVNYTPTPYPNRIGFSFHRINEVVHEGQILTEPLDELRMKVARWLHN